MSEQTSHGYLLSIFSRHQTMVDSRNQNDENEEDEGRVKYDQRDNQSHLGARPSRLDLHGLPILHEPTKSDL